MREPHTEISPKKTWYRRVAHIQAVAVIALLGWGAVQGIMALREPTVRGRIAETLTLDAFLHGKTAEAVNHAMAQKLPADPWLRAAGGVLRWKLFGSAGPSVRAGCDDWLFLIEELRPWPDAEAAMAERAAGLARIRTRLAERGVTLLIAIVPDKARVEAAQLCGVPRAAEAEARLTAWLGLLREQAVPALSLLDVLSGFPPAEPAFWRTDTHWSQTGAAAAARAIAGAAGEVALSRNAAFRTATEAQETDGPGDLLRLMSLDRMPNLLRPAPDRQRLQRSAAAADSAGGLLDEGPATEVVLLGSSYSLNANFHGRLQQEMASTIPSYALAGGGFSGAARAYFASAEFRDAPPKLVVWEIPERVVGQPVSAEERGFLLDW